MNDEEKPTEKIVEAAGKMIETYRELITVNVVQQVSLGASVSAVGLFSLILVVLTLLFVGLGSAWWVGESLSDMKAGFFIVGGVFVAIMLIILAMAKKMIIPAIRNTIIRKMYDEDN